MTEGCQNRGGEASASALYESLVRAPGRVISFRDFERLLAACGFVHERTRGSHRAYKHPHVPELLTVQPQGKDARPYQVRKFIDNNEGVRA
jgi:predicted RNA binding protein YcfA (HicA-like mRNA interferase family)